MKKIYLAVPYTHRKLSVKVERFNIVNKVAARLMSEGNLVFSPISHTHPIAMAGDLPGGWEYWAEYDKTFIEWADIVCVLRIPGWIKSIGVQAEIKMALEMNKIVNYIKP